MLMIQFWCDVLQEHHVLPLYALLDVSMVQKLQLVLTDVKPVHVVCQHWCIFIFVGKLDCFEMQMYIHNHQEGNSAP